MTDINARLSALAAAPKTHRVVTTYATGVTSIFDAHSLAAANNYADRERRKLGRDLIDRQTGGKVRVVRVTVEAL